MRLGWYMSVSASTSECLGKRVRGNAWVSRLLTRDQSLAFIAQLTPAWTTMASAIPCMSTSIGTGTLVDT